MDEYEEEYDNGPNFEEENWDSTSSFLDHVIFLVDARTPMHEKAASGESNFQKALRVIEKAMKNAVVSGDGDQFGVVFYGTLMSTEGSTSDEEAGIIRVLPLKKPSVESIQKVHGLVLQLEGPDAATFWDADYGSLDGDVLCPLRAAVRVSMDSFPAKLRAGGDSTRVLIFTDDDSPYANFSDEAEEFRQQARDAGRSGVQIEVLGMTRSGGRGFNGEKFYNSALPLAVEDEEGPVPVGRGSSGGLETFEDLLDEVQVRLVRKRRLARLPFVIAERGAGGLDREIAFAVQVHNVYQPAKRPSTIWVDKAKSKPIKLVTQYISQTTGEDLADHHIRQYVEIGGSRVYMSSDDMAALKRVNAPGFLLLGFCDQAAAAKVLRDDWALRSPYFIYPDDERVKDSVKAFVALHRAMIRKNVFALARFVRSEGSVPQVVAVLPAEEETKDAVQVSPPGMHVVFLPFPEEIREIPQPDPEPAAADDRDVAAALRLIEGAMLTDFDCRDFPNPALQKYQAKLHGIALHEETEEWDEEKDDATKPDTAQLDAQIGDAAQALSEQLELENEVLTAASKKRTGSCGAGAAAPKKAKPETDYQKVDWREVADNQTAENYTIPTLKAFLKSAGLPVSGKKGDLAERVYQHFKG